MAEFRPISTAPRDGTPIQVKIPGHGSDNIVAWFNGLLDNGGGDCGGWNWVGDNEPPDCWTDGICWEVNEDGKRSAHPTEWKPAPLTNPQRDGAKDGA